MAESFKSKSVTVNITPVGKPRQTRSDKWKKRDCVLKYRAFADQLRLYASDVHFPCIMIFRLPMPKSWSRHKKKKHANHIHTQKPDLDNLIKAVWDALMVDDSHVWKVEATKLWASEEDSRGSITFIEYDRGEL